MALAPDRTPTNSSSGTVPGSPLPRYRVDLERYERQGRSLVGFLRERMCAESRAKLGQAEESRVPVPEPRGKAVRFTRRPGRYGEDPAAVIHECCSKKPEFRNPRLPLKEVLYRLLLMDGNRPKTAEELRAETSEWVGFDYGGGRHR